MDLETRGLHPHSTADAAIGAVILRVDDQTFIFRELPAWWGEVMEDETIRKIAHNWKFDAMWMIDASMKSSVLPALCVARNLQDTMLKAQLANKYRTKMGAIKAGRPGDWEPNDLASVLDRYLGVTIGKTIDHDVTDWTGEWSNEMVEYMLEDISYLPKLNDALDNALYDQNQERAAEIENDSVFAFAWMTYNGITADIEAWHGAILDWQAHHQHLLWHLQKKFPMVENFNSPVQLLAAMPEVLGGPLLDTKKATLTGLAPHFDAIQMLLEQRHYQTRIKNWGERYLQESICPTCLRFHPEWRQIGTETSRCSCSRPNMQQIPRDPEFRKLFVAAEGTLLVSLDYSAIEVVTAAVYAEDPALLKACVSGDPHAETARMMAGLTTEEWEALPTARRKELRQNAKITNFGLLFGGGAKGLVKQAKDLFEVEISVGEAEILMYRYYQLYPRLKITKNKAYRAMDSDERCLEVRNAVGFRRYLEGYNRKPTSWLNTWIQSSAGYGLKASYKYLREAYLLPFLCLQVHDELVFEFPEDEADELAEDARRCMIQGMLDVLGAGAPVTVEVESGKVWM